MPPERPPKRSRPSPQQSAPSRTSDAEVSSHANTATHHSVQASSPSHPSASFVSVGDDDDFRNQPLTPFLNTTFSTHRLSPLYIGSQPLTQGRIHTLSHRLRDFLVGDVVRGVEVGLDRSADDGAISRVGALEAVAIAWVTLQGLIGPCPGQKWQHYGLEGDPTPARADPSDSEAGDVSGLSTSTGVLASPGKPMGLQISLQYEHAEYAALLLPPVRDAAISGDVAAAVDQAASASDPLLKFAQGGPDESDPTFLHLPLLLLRMPAPIKPAIIGFLSRTFDCRASPLNLGTRSLVRALETWARELGPETNVDSAKDVVLTLGFCAPAVMQCRRRRRQQPQNQQDMRQDKQTGDEDDTLEESEIALGVRSVDIIVPNADLMRFITAGKACEFEKDSLLKHAWDKRKRAGPDCRDSSEAKRRNLGGHKDEEGWIWRQWPVRPEPSMSRSNFAQPQPFIEALAQYLQQQLALDMFHPAVRISKIACGGFVLSGGRVKIFGTSPSAEPDHGISDDNQRAVLGILSGLLEKACAKPPKEILRGKPV